MVASAGELTDLELAGGKVAVRSSSLLVGKSKVKVIDFNDLKVESSMQSLKHGSDTFSLLTRCLEKRAVKALLDLLEATRRKLPTSLSDDWEALKSLKYSSESAPSSSSQKLLLALIYRVTKKRILEIAILRLQALASHLDGVSKVSPESVEDSARRIWLSPMDVETLEPLTGSCDLCTVSDEGFFALHQYLVDVNESSD